MSKIEAVAVRDFRLDGLRIAKGTQIELPTNQFNDLKAIGFVKVAVKEAKPVTKAG